MSLPQDNSPLVAFDPLPASDLNNMRTNIGALSAGTGLEDGAVTAGKLGLGAKTAVVETSQTRTSSTFGDLSTPGPAVTVNIGAGGQALVTIYSNITNSSAGHSTGVSFDVSGANTQAATTSIYYLAQIASGSSDAMRAGATWLLTGLTPGSTTFTLKYRASGGTGTFNDRVITVIPLG